jgi:hypothetical protein
MPKMAGKSYGHLDLTSDRLCPSLGDGMAPETDGMPHHKNGASATSTLRRRRHGTDDHGAGVNSRQSTSRDFSAALVLTTHI